MTYGSKTKNQHRLGPVAVVRRPQDDRVSAKWLGFWTKDTPYIPADAPDHPATSTGGSGPTPTAATASTAPSPTSRPTSRAATPIQADVSHYAEGFLGEHDLKFGVQYTKGRSNSQGGYFQNYVNFLYPYRWTQSVQYMQSWYGDTGLLFYNHKDTINPSLTVRTADSIGVFFDDQWTPTERLTINLGLRFDHMTAKYGVGKVYDFPTSPDQFDDPPHRPARPRLDRQHLRLQDVVPPRRRELPADGGRQDRGAGLVRPLLRAAQRRVPPKVRPRHAHREPDLPDVRGRAVGHGRHQR